MVYIGIISIIFVVYRYRIDILLLCISVSYRYSFLSVDIVSCFCGCEYRYHIDKFCCFSVLYRVRLSSRYPTPGVDTSCYIYINCASMVILVYFHGVHDGKSLFHWCEDLCDLFDLCVEHAINTMFSWLFGVLARCSVYSVCLTSSFGWC